MIFQRFLKWITLENRHSIILQRREQAGLLSSMINISLVNKGGQVWFIKDWDFLCLEFLSYNTNTRCAKHTPGPASMWLLLDLEGKGNQYEHEPQAACGAVSNQVLCLWPRRHTSKHPWNCGQLTYWTARRLKNLRKVLVCDEFIFGIRKMQSCLAWLVCFHLIKTVSLKITAFPSLLWWLRNPEANLQHSQFVHIFITKSVHISLNLILLISTIYFPHLFVYCILCIYEYVKCWDTNNSTNPSQ